MELPRSAGDPVPSTTPGALLALADRFDLLAGAVRDRRQADRVVGPVRAAPGGAGVVAILRAHPTLRAITVEPG